MQTRFQDFLRQKAEESGARERNRDRGEWLQALRRLLDQIQDWLRAADPENLLETVPYDVERVEGRLGIYDAPALKIRLGTDEVDVVPVGRYAVGPLPAQSMRSLLGVEVTDGPAAGRVDITNGERKYLLIRDVSTGQDRWYAPDEQSKAALLDQAHLETILQDLWS
jgi:hypothetical protein